MKNLIMIALVLIGMVGYAQTTPLTKVNILTSEPFLISSYQGNDNFSWTTDTEHKYFDNSNYTIGNSSTCSFGFNNINANLSATGDTLDITDEYYSLSNGTLIWNGTQVSGIPTDLTMTYTSIANDNNGSVYILGKNGSMSNIYKVTSGIVSATYNFTTPGQGSELNGYTNITYFESDGSYYLMFIGEIQNGVTTHPWAIVDISNLTITSIMFGNLSLNITNAVSFNDVLYFNIDNEIFEATTISSVLPNNVLYNIPTGETINDFTITDNGIFYVAASNGIYSSNMSLNIENEEELNINSTLYPNPNNGTFTITEVEEGTTTQILNQAGQVVYETNDYGNLDLNIDVPSGIYFVRLMNDSNSKTIKFVKQ